MIEKELITRAVEEVLRRNPNWAPALSNDLINPSKVARKIMDDVVRLLKRKPGSVKLNSVVKAVGVYARKAGKVSDLERVKKTIAGSTVSLLTNLSIIVVRPRSGLKEKISKVMDIVYKGDQVLYTNQGRLILSLMFSTKYEKGIKSIFAPDEILALYDKNAGILLESPELSTYDPITYDSYMLNLLASQGIPIVWYSSTYTDAIIVVDDPDAGRAFQVIKGEVDILKGAKRNG